MDVLARLKELVQTEYHDDENVVNARLVSYLTETSHLDNEHDMYTACSILMDSDITEHNKPFIISKMLSLLTVEIPIQMKLFIGFFLLLECKFHSMELIQDYQGFAVVYHQLRSLNEHELATILMDLLYNMCKYLATHETDLAMVDDAFIKALMFLRTDTVEDPYTNAKFRLLLALNEQYMITGLPNKVLQNVSKQFPVLLLLTFNRVKDRSLQVLVCKMLYLMFTHSHDKYFYVNDLRVLVDVLIREICDLSEEEDEIRCTFLRVLYPLLQHPSISGYRKQDLVSILENLSGKNTLWSPSEKTRKLSSQCLSVTWLSPALSEARHSPPPPPPRKRIARP